MGIAYYPSFERSIDGFDPALEVNGVAIGRSIEILDAIAAERKIRSLPSFISDSSREMLEAIGEVASADLPDRHSRKPRPQSGLLPYEV